MNAGYRRRSARVLLLDGAGRILLLRFLLDPTDAASGRGWITPGGGVNEGESLAAAAARELHEEVGLAVAAQDLGRPVAYTTGYAKFEWADGVFRDDFFYYRVDAHDVDASNMEALERSYHAGYRWWTIREIGTATDIIYPFGLAALLADLVAGRIPAEPIRLPWHH